MVMLRSWWIALVLVPGCYDGVEPPANADPGSETGEADDDDDAHDTADDEDDEPLADWEDPGLLGVQGLRRQTHAELRKTLRLLFDSSDAELDVLLTALPADTQTPFDNAYRDQDPSQPLLEGMVTLAEGLSERIAADPSRRDGLLGCSPTGPTDADCLRTFVTHFGRLALRRPLFADEIETYVAFIADAQQDDDFNSAFQLALQAILLDVRFLYQVEVGEPADMAGVRRLDGFEMASRLSFLLWGSGPDDTLLDLAEDGTLDSSGGVADVARALLADPRGVEQVQRLHAMWLSYDALAVEPTLAASLRQETDALVGRVLERGSWTELFVSDETYLDETLSEHYGIPLPAGEHGWVTYPDVRRGGLLSHGSFLAIGKKFSDTSPTERGKAVWTRLLCQTIPPPPAQVDSGIPPAGNPNACKSERYAPLREDPSCATCHSIIDGIGFGLENYGPAGEWRTSEPDNPDCKIEGYGHLTGGEDFAGAAALGEQLVDTGKLEACFTRSVYQFAIGRMPNLADDADAAVLGALATKFEASDDLRELLVAFAASDAFRHRVTEEAK